MFEYVRLFVECIGWVVTLSGAIVVAVWIVDKSLTHLVRRLGLWDDILQAHRRNLADKKAALKGDGDGR